MTRPASREIRVAAAQYGLDYLQSWDDYRQKLARLVEEATGEMARLLVFPEYAALELASLFPPEVQQSLSGQLHTLQSYLTPFLDLHAALARRHDVYILAGSFPVEVAPRVYRNRAYFFAPGGAMGYQEKLVMTRFENEQWFVSPGIAAKTFVTDFGRVAVNICYDSEFPLLARAAVEEGAELILVPSCTDTLAGYHRVRIGCQARALENQCYVVQSPLVGHAEWSPAVDVNVGAAGIYTPVDHGFPADGVLTVGTMNTPQWVYATLDLEQVRHIRETGQVFNHRDWPHQLNRGPVEVVEL